MRFVLANQFTRRPGGTEVHLLTLAKQLRRLGHESVIFSPEAGAYADHIRSHGFEVTRSTEDLHGTFDVLFSQDAIVALKLAERFPDPLHLFRLCSDVYDFELPPQIDGIVDAVVVLSERYERLARSCAVSSPVLRLRVPIETDHLQPPSPIRPRPRRAVLLGNYPDRHALVTEAWGRHGIEITKVGGSDPRVDITAALAQADIVVAKSRAALDAMARGRAVYVLDLFGGDGWVTPATYPALEADNFCGQATDRVIGLAELEHDLADYHPEMGVANRDLILQHHAAHQHVLELLEVIERLTRSERPAAPMSELARLTGLQLSWELFARENRQTLVTVQAQTQAEIERLRAEIERLRAEIERLSAEATVINTAQSRGRILDTVRSKIRPRSE